jgi:phosphonate metabolism-associated iron-containing alcohol dehydrogenase
MVDRVRGLLGDRLAGVEDSVTPNPCVHALRERSRLWAGKGLDGMVAVGGGSALDTAKFLRVVLAEGVDPDQVATDLLAGRPLGTSSVLPMVAVPTTAGTGSEVTPFATIWDSRTRKKHSLTAPALFPDVALLDPRLTLDLPEEVTVSGALDALSQGLESIWNRHGDAVSASHGTQAVRLVLESLPSVLTAPGDVEVRTRLMEASLLAGLAISQTRTALAHSMSYPVTARLGLPHGLACSFMLPALLEFNMAADDGELSGLVAALGLPDWQALQSRLSEMLRVSGMSGYLARYGVDANSTLPLVGEMFTPGRVDNNLRTPTLDDVEALLRKSLEARE